MNHSFSIHYAMSYGVAEAIMINNFQYWIGKNKANDMHQYDGRTWTYNSVTAFSAIFPYWTQSQIRRCLESLVEQGVLVKGEYNKNPHNRTSWYAFFDESTFLNQQMHLSKNTNGVVENHSSITNINTDINTDKKQNNRASDLPEKIQAIISKINQHAGTSFRAETKESNKLIAARLKTYTLDESLRVVDWMAQKWLKTDMRQYYTPVTLFRESNFEKYLQNANANCKNTTSGEHINDPDYKWGKMRYRPQSEFGSYTQYLKNCNEYGHTPREEGND